MKLSYRKLRELGVNGTISEIETALLQLGHEIEEIKTTEIQNLVVGKVVSIEKHKQADKLSICQVDVGQNQKLEIICGAPNIAQDQLVVVAKVGCKLPELEIKPTTIKGVESQGMICSLAELIPDGKLDSQYKENILVLDEQIYEIGDDFAKKAQINDSIFDVSLTANRGDCWNYRGIIRDLRAYSQIHSQTIKFERELIEHGRPLPFEKEEDFYNFSTNKVLQFSTQKVSYANQKSSLEAVIFLNKHDIKAQNAIVDNANIIMLEEGTPIHTYDADKLVGELKVLELEKAQSFIALDEKEYQLEKGNLVIADEEKIVALAGVIGSESSKVDESTQNIVVEVANFDAQAVRNSAKTIKLKTDASLRFERGIDNSIIEEVQRRISNIFKAGSNILKTTVIYPPKHYEIPIDYKEINNYLGTNFSKAEINAVLAALEFEVDHYGLVLVPFARNDVQGLQDLAEEVIRVYSIDTLGVSQPIKQLKGLNPKQNQFERALEDELLQNGLNQVITYSLVSKSINQKYLFEPQKAVELDNPLSEEHAVYRQNLAHSLVEHALYNQFNRQEAVNSFEIGNAYYYDASGQLKEEKHLGAVLSGVANGQEVTFFDLKAIIEKCLKNLDIDLKFEPLKQEIEQLNMYASAQISYQEEVIGFIGEVHPNEVKKATAPIYIANLNLSKLNVNEIKKSYQAINQYPISKRDLTITVPKEELYQNVVSELQNLKYLQEIKFKEIYLKEQEKAITVTLFFTRTDQTITNEEIEVEVQDLYKRLALKNYIVYS